LVNKQNISLCIIYIMQTVNSPSQTLSGTPSSAPSGPRVGSSAASTAVVVAPSVTPSISPSGPVICPLAAGQAGGISSMCECPYPYPDNSFKSAFQGKKFTYWCTDNR
jgi:hypothetical protein